MDERLVVIRTLDQLNALREYLDDKTFISFDTETTGLSRDSEIIGFSVAADTTEAYYVVMKEWLGGRLITFFDDSVGKQFCTDLVGKSLIMHNAVFDCIMVKARYNVDLMPSVHTDTMVLAHLLDENRPCGLKELGLAIFGETADQEKREMLTSIVANGGKTTKKEYELYKADSQLIGRYGAKDTILTLKLFYYMVPQLFEEKLDQFFYEDECMPLLRGPTYDLNATGLRVEPDKLQLLKQQLETDCLEALAFIHKEIAQHVKDKYPGTTKSNHFNINAPQQLSWLLFERLGCEFKTLTAAGKEVCKHLLGRLPYTAAAKRDFIQSCKDSFGREYAPAAKNLKTGKAIRAKKISDPWKYIAADKATLVTYASRFKWVAKYLEYAKNKKLLNTYVSGIEERMTYNIIRPGFKQTGTTSGRYSSSNPNFQNLPRDDKRVKSCITARPGMVFVGADESQLEVRCFASIAQDTTLMNCFAEGLDFYSVIGAPIFDKHDCSLIKDSPDSFAKKYPKLRDASKVIGLATPYGRTARQQAEQLNMKEDDAQELINNYFTRYPAVKKMMLDSHEEAKSKGCVYNIYGRPRRIPAATAIPMLYGRSTRHQDLPYEARTLLNLAMNHRVQSTAASIMNRASIAVWARIRHIPNARIVLQVHDELVVECPEAYAQEVAAILQDCMENAVTLPGVRLEAKPVIGKTLAELK